MALFREGVAVHEVWPYVLGIFVSGGVMTAVGLKVMGNDLLVLAGMVVTSVGIAGMWLPGRGPIRRGQASAVGTFLLGNSCTAASLTLVTSNPLLATGMILSALGIGGMWLIGKHGLIASGIFGTFVLGISLQALGLTVFPSDLSIGFGMMFVSVAIFGMWLHSHPFQFVRDYERDEVLGHAIQNQQETLDVHSR